MQRLPIPQKMQTPQTHPRENNCTRRGTTKPPRTRHLSRNPRPQLTQNQKKHIHIIKIISQQHHFFFHPLTHSPFKKIEIQSLHAPYLTPARPKKTMTHYICESVPTNKKPGTRVSRTLNPDTSHSWKWHCSCSPHVTSSHDCQHIKEAERAIELANYYRVLSNEFWITHDGVGTHNMVTLKPQYEESLLINHQLQNTNTCTIRPQQADHYTVKYDYNKHWSCTCKGFKYRAPRICKHIKKIKKRESKTH